MLSRLALVSLIAYFGSLVSGHSEFQPADWPAGVQDIRFTSSKDQFEEPALFLPATGSEPRPLVLFLHQWGGDYLYQAGSPIARWAKEKNWNYVQPHFRGPNVRPEAMGSDLVISDIVDVIEYAKKHGPVDTSRIFLVGASGGGHASLLVASRLPGVFRGVSAWVPITDLVAWHNQCLNNKYSRYSKNIRTACGGELTPGSPAEAEAKKRSPLTHLTQPNGMTHFDLNAGIHDGHTGSVPISHTLNAYNQMAQEQDRVTPELIVTMTETATVPEEARFTAGDASYGKSNPVLFRKESDRVRVSLFEGGHELVRPAALAWIEKIAAQQ